MADKIRLGFVGANVNSTWSTQSHFPALLASPDVEFTAVCTTRPESAEEARQAFGAKLAFHDFRTMAESDEIDAVAVVVRVPSHYEPTKAAIEAGKHVLTEWPLGRNTAEAVELADLARAKGVQTTVGLQSRVSPALLYVKDLIETGYVGEVLSCSVNTFRDGPLQRTSDRTWQRDASLGAHTLTIATGHVIDALRFVAGDFSRVACMVTTQVPQWYEPDTEQMVDTTSPDNVRVSGQLANGAAAHFESLPSEMPGGRTDSWFGFEAYGTRGIISVRNSPKGNMFVYPYGQWIPGNDDEKWEPVVLDEWGLHEDVPARSSMHLSNRMIVRELIEAVAEGRDVVRSSSDRDARAALEMIMAVHESHRLGTRVEFPMANRENPYEVWRRES